MGALRGLGENPLAVYLRQAEQRRLRRGGWWRRNLSYLLLLLLELLIAGLILTDSASNGNWRWWAPFDDPELGLSLLALLILPLYGLWACQGLYQALLDALLVLAPPSRRTHSLAIDDLSAITLLTGREFIAGALAVLLPPLLWRLGVGVFLAWQVLLACAYGTQYLGWYLLPNATPDAISTSTALAMGPLTMAALALAGALALAILLLFMLALGRRMQGTLASVSAALMVLAQLFYTLAAYALLIASLEELPVQTPLWVCHLEKLALALLAAWLIAAALSAAERSAAWRYILAVGTPMLAVLLPLLIFVPVGFWTDWDNEVMEVMIYPLYAYAVQLGAVSVLNPQALFSPLCWGDLGHVLKAPWPEALRYPATLALQLALLAITANYALRAVRLRRQVE
jgi:hypothetical protein